MHVSFPVSELAVTPADIDSAEPPQVESGAYQVQIGSPFDDPATLSADFTVR